MRPRLPHRAGALGALPFILLGAIGMIASNMLSKEPLLVSSGPVRRHLMYHLFMKPAVGAFAAFLFYITAKSQILFSIVSVFDLKALTSSTPSTSSVDAPALIVLSTPAAVQYAFAVLSVACGYSADRMLRSTIDRVLSRLFMVADKDAKTPTPEEAINAT